MHFFGPGWEGAKSAETFEGGKGKKRRVRVKTLKPPTAAEFHPSGQGSEAGNLLSSPQLPKPGIIELDILFYPLSCLKIV